MLAAGAVVFHCSHPAAAATGTTAIVYVDDSAPPPGNGISWPTSFADLQGGLDAAAGLLAAGTPVVEIHIGQGVYRPSLQIDQADPRSAVFQARSNVALMGGYAGFGARNPDSRDPGFFVSTVSGDLANDDGPPGSFTNNVENTYHVVSTSGTDMTCVLDGLTITAGNACCGLNQNDLRGYGGGVQNLAGSPTLINCKITYCVGNRGGGLYSDMGMPSFFGCTFIGNEASGKNAEGGGIHSAGGGLTLTNCDFENNSAGRAGGLYHRNGAATLTNCRFTANHATGDNAGGVYNLFGSVHVQDCTFDSNDAAFACGAMSSSSHISATIENSVFVNNQSEITGAFGGEGNNLQIRGCTFVANAGDFGGAVQITYGAPLIEDCTFSNNATIGAGGAIYMNFSERGTVVRRCLFESNFATFGGALSSGNGTALFADCRFQSNASASSGGAVNTGGISPKTFLNCVFVQNSSSFLGGAMATSGAATSLINCLFAQNHATGQGGAIRNNGTGLKIMNCTLVGNIAGTGGGGALYTSNATGPTIANSILWANAPNQIRDFLMATTVRYSNIQGGWPGAGEHNLNANPRFVNPAAGDFALAGDSPCIDAGDNFAVPKGILTDLNDQPRFHDVESTPDTGLGMPPIVDFGCFEAQRATPACTSDCAQPSNGNVGMEDLSAVITAWGNSPGNPADLNGDGRVNIDDLVQVILDWGPCAP